MTVLKVHASACDSEPMVQSDEIRRAFVSRLRLALAQAGFPEWGAGARLAEIARATPKAASKWLNAESMPSRAKMEAIAEALKVRVEWLEYGEGSQSPFVSDEMYNVQTMPQPERYYRYPVLTRVAAGAFASAVQPYAPGAEDEWEYSDYKATGPAFWFEVTGHSMTSPTPPSFPPGVLVLIDTGIEPQPGDYVLATIPDEEEATFKQLIREDGQLYLKPLNPDYRTMPVAEGCRLIGKAKEAKFKL